MEPSSENTGATPPKTEVNKEVLTAEIAEGIKRKVLGEETVTYNNGLNSGIQRDCFLTTPDKIRKMVISYTHNVWDDGDEQDITGNIEVRVIDSATDPPVGYKLSLKRPINDETMTEEERFTESGLNFFEKLPPIAVEEASDTGEAVYGVSFLDAGSELSDTAMEEKRREGLLLINSLLKSAPYDITAITDAKQWLRTKGKPPINDLDQLTGLRSIFESTIDSSLESLPAVVNRRFPQ